MTPSTKTFTKLIYFLAKLLAVFGLAVPLLSGAVLRVLFEGPIPKNAHYWTMLQTTLEVSLIANIALLITMVFVIANSAIMKDRE